MKQNVLFVYPLMLLFSVPAQALDANSCAAKSAQLKPSERNAYMKSCLAQVGSPANVREVELQHKKSLCEQNAKNNKFQGNDRASYIETCMNKNEAAEAAANTVPATAVDRIERPVEKTRTKTAKPASPPADADKNAKPKAKSKRNPKVTNKGEGEPAK